MHNSKYCKTPMENQYGNFLLHNVSYFLQTFLRECSRLVCPVGKPHLHPMFVNTKNTFNTHIMCWQAVKIGKPGALINTGCLCLKQKVLWLQGVNHGSIWTMPQWICLSQTILKPTITSQQQMLSNNVIKSPPANRAAWINHFCLCYSHP